MNKNLQYRKATKRGGVESERRITFTFISRENSGKRFDWKSGRDYEELIDVNGVDFSKMRTFFKDHDYCVDNAIGRIENVRVEDGELVGDVVFGADEDSMKIFQKFNEGILTDVSVGYRVEKELVTKRENQIDLHTITKCKAYELSAVWKGFDEGAKIKRMAELEDEYKKREQQIKLYEESL